MLVIAGQTAYVYCILADFFFFKIRNIFTIVYEFQLFIKLFAHINLI